MTLRTSFRPRRVARSPAHGFFRFVSGPRTALSTASGTLLVLLLAACGGGAGSGPANSPDAPADAEAEAENRSYSPNEISRAEILERGSNSSNAMQVIRRLRPAWLRARGSNSFTSAGAMYAVVYVDNIRRPGGLSALFNIPVGEIRMMEFIGPANATTRWGTGLQSGVILVVTGR